MKFDLGYARPTNLLTDRRKRWTLECEQTDRPTFTSIWTKNSEVLQALKNHSTKTWYIKKKYWQDSISKKKAMVRRFQATYACRRKYLLSAQKNPIAIHKTFVMLFGMLKFHQKLEQIEDSLFCISRKRHYMYTFISRVVECDYCVVFEHVRLHNLIFHQGTDNICIHNKPTKTEHFNHILKFTCTKNVKILSIYVIFPYMYVWRGCGWSWNVKIQITKIKLYALLYVEICKY